MSMFEINPIDKNSTHKRYYVNDIIAYDNKNVRYNINMKQGLSLAPVLLMA